MNDNRLHVISLEKKNHMKEYMYKDVSNMHKIMQYYRILTTTNSRM